MPTPFRMTEIPLAHLRDTPCAEFLAYWQQCRGDAWAPTLKAFDLPRLPTHLIPSVAIVDVIAGGENFRYRFWGTAQSEVKGYDLTGKLVTETPGEVFHQSGLAQYRQVVETRAPVAFLYETPYAHVTSSGRQLTVRAPLAGAGPDDADEVAHVVAFQNLLMDPKAWEELWKTARR